MFNCNILHNVSPNILLSMLPSPLSNDLPHHSTSNIDYALCITLGNYLIAISLSVMTMSILISYVFTEHFSLGVQITAHISTIITAAIAKIGYVIRCIGAHGLGHKAF
jgi:hypothetical protein